MKGNSHVRFGERGGETRLPQGRKVRSAPTLRSGGMYVQSARFVSERRRSANRSAGAGLPTVSPTPPLGPVS